VFLLAEAGEIGRVDAAVFADPGDESEATYQFLAKLESVSVSVPIVRASRERSLSEECLRSMRETRSGFLPIPSYALEPDRSRESQGRRQCTRWAKLDVVHRVARELIGLRPGQHARPRDAVEVLVGISTDEAQRMKPSRFPLLTNSWPLIERGWSRSDCREYVQQTLGVDPPRSACVYCPFHNDSEWIEMKETDPVSFARAVAFEKDIRALDPSQFLHASCKPLEEVQLDPDRQLDLFGSECEGMCGV
jgi:hypothetical protein